MHTDTCLADHLQQGEQPSSPLSSQVSGEIASHFQQNPVQESDLTIHHMRNRLQDNIRKHKHTSMMAQSDMVLQLLQSQLITLRL